MTSWVFEVHLTGSIVLHSIMQHSFFVVLPFPDLIFEFFVRQSTCKAACTFSNNSLIDESLKLPRNDFVELAVLNGSHLSVFKGNLVHQNSLSGVWEPWLLLVDIMELADTHDLPVSKFYLAGMKSLCFFDFQTEHDLLSCHSLMLRLFLFATCQRRERFDPHVFIRWYFDLRERRGILLVRTGRYLLFCILVLFLSSLLRVH